MATIHIITLEELGGVRNIWAQEGTKIAFIPTMGALHEGHIEVIKSARKQAGRVMVSLFVNPLQSGLNESYSKYPRTLKEDVELLESLGIDAIFIPNAIEIFPASFQTYVVNGLLRSLIESPSLEGYFTGVMTSSLRFFNIIRPHIVVLGKKNYLELVLLQNMIRDLSLDIQVVAVNTVRDASGLALDRVNRFLGDEQKVVAANVYKGLLAVRERFIAGTRNRATLIQSLREQLKSYSQICLEEVSILSQISLDNPGDEVEGKSFLFVVYSINNIRLVDSMEMEHSG